MAWKEGGKALAHGQKLDWSNGQAIETAVVRREVRTFCATPSPVPASLVG